MDYATLRDRAMAKLTEQGHAGLVKLLRHSENLAELNSCLREYVPGLRSDAKVQTFLATCTISPINRINPINQNATQT